MIGIEGTNKVWITAIPGRDGERQGGSMRFHVRVHQRCNGLWISAFPDVPDDCPWDVPDVYRVCAASVPDMCRIIGTSLADTGSSRAGKEPNSGKRAGFR